MNRALSESHPYSLISQIVSAYPTDVILTFSRYTYVAQSSIDVREEFEVSGSLVTRDWTENLVSTLPEGVDVSLHSRVRLKSGETRHIPMIDFAGEVDAEDGAILASLLAKLGVPTLELYRSGRSFHGYGTSLLEEPNWLRFAATLLLANLPNRRHVVDCRWVGHRLRAGYGALRWSCNSPQYKQLPVHAGQIGLGRFSIQPAPYQPAPEGFPSD